MEPKKPISNVFLEDCNIGMKRFPDKFFELAICDPEYGIGMGNRIGTTYKNGVVKNKSGFANKALYKKSNWDKQIPSTDYFNELFRVSKNQIIWGGNYFQLPLSRGWIYWHKKIANHSIENYADGELAWTSFDRVLKQFTYDWVGLGGINSGEQRIHQTQKPVKLYKWLLHNYAKPGDKILDTHLGSMSSRIAAYHMGFDFWGYEIDKEYFEAGNKRFIEQTAQLSLL